MHDKTIIALRDVSFSYSKQSVISHITLDVHEGDYLGIVGPNGGGKTTLLKLMLGLLKPNSGTISLFDQDITTFKDWEKIGYVPQKVVNFDTSFPATVLEVVSMGRFAQRGLFQRLNSEDKHFVREALNEVGMYVFKDRLIGDLSGGQQQRVFIARALATKPQIIFLDEPTVGVDIKAQEEFYTLLKKLNKDLRITLLLVSHDLDVVTNEVTEVACINQEIVYHGSSKEFVKDDYLHKLYGAGVKFILHKH